MHMHQKKNKKQLKYETQHVVRSAFDDFDLLDTIETKSLTFVWSWILKTLSRNNKKQGQLRTTVGMGMCSRMELSLEEPALDAPWFYGCHLSPLVFSICENVRSCQKRRIPSYRGTTMRQKRGNPMEKRISCRFVIACSLPCSLANENVSRSPRLAGL